MTGFSLFDGDGCICRVVEGGGIETRDANLTDLAGYVEGVGDPETHYVELVEGEPVMMARPIWSMPVVPIQVATGDSLNLSYPVGSTVVCGGSSEVVPASGVLEITFLHDGEFELQILNCFPYREWSGMVIVQ